MNILSKIGLGHTNGSFNFKEGSRSRSRIFFINDSSHLLDRGKPLQPSRGSALPRCSFLVYVSLSYCSHGSLCRIPATILPWCLRQL